MPTVWILYIIQMFNMTYTFTPSYDHTIYIYYTTGQPRGYAFVEFEKETDMTEAYKRADAKKLDGRRIVVDVERGR